MDSKQQQKNIFSRNLRRHLRLCGKTQADLVNDLKITSSTVSDWVNAKKYPRMDKVQMLADYLHIYKSDLIEDKSHSDDEKVYNDIEVSYVKVPLYEALCCGNGGFVDDNIIDMIPVPSKGLSKSAKYFAQYASGESMKDAGISDGDLLIFEKVNKVDDGVIGCFCTDTNTATCKKYKELNGIIMLQPMNADYDPIVVDPLNNNIRCLGKLKKVIKDFSWED